jgi:hypothetical protein
MGGGFGGCTINLVKDEVYDQFIADAKKKFSEKYGHEPEIILRLHDILLRRILRNKEKGGLVDSSSFSLFRRQQSFFCSHYRLKSIRVNFSRPRLIKK